MWWKHVHQSLFKGIDGRSVRRSGKRDAGAVCSGAGTYNMLIDLMAAMSHKDWLSRRQRQKQGIERAHTLGKYRGKQADQERHQKVLYYRQVKKLSIQETADATGYSASQVCRIQALHKNNEST